MSVSKLSAAAVNASLEIQPALANLNFDFSLWKVTAPKEFEGVGAALTTDRREQAENGTPHMTARKLGALFERLLPLTPELIKAYGQRASEISQSSSAITHGNSAYGVFASRVGADATSLWAAATSGSGAIGVHLLACMLARIWDGPEATSIWVEIVARRKQQINDDFLKSNVADLATLAAARQDLTRAQISEWDASARAWLRAADVVKSRQQKQLMLILDNICQSVNKKADTYESVITAWTNALNQMEGLIKGISQQTQGADILLALSAWHLFPDLVVVIPRTAHINQRDPIFASGGVLTIGLDSPDSQRNGIYWSLPLAHLRHYGAPVISSQSINSSERSRISTNELLQATLGCLLQSWDEAGSDTLKVVTWLHNILMLLEKAASAGLPAANVLLKGEAASSWFNMFLLTARQYLTSCEDERKMANKLISLGRKHGKKFLGRPLEPVFGLLKRGSWVSMIAMDDDKIHYLREIAQEIAEKEKFDPTQIFIRYKRRYPEWNKAVYEYTTALPWPRETSKRRRDESAIESRGHRRWLYAGGNLTIRADDWRYYSRLTEKFGQIDDKWMRVPGDFGSWHKERSTKPTFSSDRDLFSTEGHSIRKEFENRRRFYSSLGEDVDERENELIEDFAESELGIFWDQMGFQKAKGIQTPWYRLMYGDHDSAAIYALEGRENLVDLSITPGREATELYGHFEKGKMNAAAVVHKLHNIFRYANPESDPYLKSLKAVSTAARIYQRFSDTSVDIRVLQQPLFSAAWVRACPPDNFQLVPDDVPVSLKPYRLNRMIAFACITMFESGKYDIDPSILENVMAMSSEDTIYVGGALLTDPSEEPRPERIERILGNIGRPGIAFLVPPLNPLIREVKMSDWPRISREMFDGQIQDGFQNTSLHLSFTGASSTVNVGFSGGQDVEVYMLETLISVHEGGSWIADLNVFKMLESINFRRLNACENHSHESSLPAPQATAIDNWFELIDPPEDHISVLRAHKNWQARLAGATISIAIGRETLVVPSKVCWYCFNKKAEEFSWRKFTHKVVIIS